VIHTLTGDPVPQGTILTSSVTGPADEVTDGVGFFPYFTLGYLIQRFLIRRLSYGSSVYSTRLLASPSPPTGLTPVNPSTRGHNQRFGQIYVPNQTMELIILPTVYVIIILHSLVEIIGLTTKLTYNQ